MKNELHFEKVKDMYTVVGGFKGKLRVKLVGFDVKPTQAGKLNYQFKMELLDYPGETISYNTVDYYKSVMNNLAQQLGFEDGSKATHTDILKKASEEEFHIWKDEYINFYDREAYLKSLNEEPVEL